MSNSNDVKGGVGADKLEPHPDFEELLKAEQSRITPKPDKSGEKNESVSTDDFNLDDEPDDEDSDGHHDFSDHNKKDLKDELKENPKENNDDSSEFSDIEGGSLDDGQDSSSSTLDDSMEFNFDDTSSVSSGSAGEAGGSSVSNVKKAPVKKSSGLVFYIVIAVVVVVVGYFGYSFLHRGAQSRANQNAQAGTGFKPVLPVVHALPHSLPPALPQTLQPASTTVMEGASNEQVLTGTPQNYQAGGGITMLQVNRQELLQLLANFQTVVDKNAQSMKDDITSLKSSLSAINVSDAKISQVIDGRLQQVNSQIDLINQKFDTYNQSIAGVQSALEKTQDQLKLILAQRAEDIDHYTLRAIVPGRAWLVDGQGNTVTIIVGQEIKNYGKVQEINDKMGYVTMSSGFVFK